MDLIRKIFPSSSSNSTNKNNEGERAQGGHPTLRRSGSSSDSANSHDDLSDATSNSPCSSPSSNSSTNTSKSHKSSRRGRKFAYKDSTVESSNGKGPLIKRSPSSSPDGKELQAYKLGRKRSKTESNASTSEPDSANYGTPQIQEPNALDDYWDNIEFQQLVVSLSNFLESLDAHRKRWSVTGSLKAKPDPNAPKMFLKKGPPGYDNYLNQPPALHTTRSYGPYLFPYRHRSPLRQSESSEDFVATPEDWTTAETTWGQRHIIPTPRHPRGVWDRWGEPGCYPFYQLLGETPRQKIGVYEPQNKYEIKWTESYEKMWALQDRERELRARGRTLKRAYQNATRNLSQEQFSRSTSPTRKHLVLEHAWHATRSPLDESKEVHEIVIDSQLDTQNVINSTEDANISQNSGLPLPKSKKSPEIKFKLWEPFPPAPSSPETSSLEYDAIDPILRQLDEAMSLDDYLGNQFLGSLLDDDDDEPSIEHVEDSSNPSDNEEYIPLTRTPKVRLKLTFKDSVLGNGPSNPTPQRPSVNSCRELIPYDPFADHPTGFDEIWPLAPQEGPSSPPQLNTFHHPGETEEFKYYSPELTRKLMHLEWFVARVNESEIEGCDFPPGGAEALFGPDLGIMDGWWSGGEDAAGLTWKWNGVRWKGKMVDRGGWFEADDEGEEEEVDEDAMNLETFGYCGVI